MSPLWMSIEPDVVETRLMLTQAQVGTVLRARLPLLPVHPRGLAMLLESLAAWYGQPFSAVLDAEAQDVHRHQERWARLLGDLEGGPVTVTWVGHTTNLRRDRFLGAVGDFRRARRLVTFAATGQK